MMCGERLVAERFAGGRRRRDDNVLAIDTRLDRIDLVEIEITSQKLGFVGSQPAEFGGLYYLCALGVVNSSVGRTLSPIES